ncbi:MAG: septum formation initiator family protein [Pseudomonadota bacterium]
MIRRFFFEIAAPAAVACWAAYFVFAALFGASSVRVLQTLESEAQERREDVDALTRRREALERRADMLHPSSLDADLVDERVRAVLGYARDGDLILPRSELDALLQSASDDAAP